MPEHEDFYMPAQIDEQVDALLQAREMPARDQRMADDLRAILEHEQENARSLQSVLHKLLTDISEQPTARIASFSAKQQPGRSVRMQTTSQPQKARKQRSMVRVWSALAAVLLIVVLVGSMLLILNIVHQSKNGALTAGSQEATATAEALSEGKILYTSGKVGAAGPLSWSPDGKRVATVINSGIIESWDVLTGKNIVTYHIVGDIASLSMVAWSPDGTRLAVVGGQRIYIFNARNVQVIRTISLPLALNSSGSPLVFSDAARLPLSSLMPSSGGANIPKDIAWSPDGRYLSTSFLNNPNGIYIWDAQSGVLVKHLATLSTNFYGRAFWQPHGTLLAVIVCAESCESTQIVVLNTTTWSIVRHFSSYTQLDWSPDGKQLALANAANATVRIVDVQTGQTVKQFTDRQAALIGELHWSPDGTRLALEAKAASADSSLTITTSIWSTTSWTLLYMFPQKGTYGITWSPNSKYISCVQMKETGSGKMVSDYEQILVWVA